MNVCEAIVITSKIKPVLSSALPGSIVVSISACHAEDRGSIPRQGAFFCTFPMVLMASSLVLVYIFWIHLLGSPVVRFIRQPLLISALSLGVEERRNSLRPLAFLRSPSKYHLYTLRGDH